jgi:hypothetical protein
LDSVTTERMGSSSVGWKNSELLNILVAVIFALDQK